MSNHPTEDNAERLAESARNLLSVTSDIAEDTVREARSQLEAALDNGRDALVQARDQASRSLGAADGALREHPYAFAGIAFTVGVAAAFLLRWCKK